MKKIFIILLVVLFTINAFAGGAGESMDDKMMDGEKYFALISKGTQHEFWKTVELGAQEAAKSIGAKITFVGPATEAEIDKQINMVEEAIGKKPAGIALAALDVKALTPLANKINAAKIPLVTFDSDVQTGVAASFIATDNKAAAAVGADQLGTILKGAGKVAILVHDPSSSTGIDRRDGFIAQIKAKFPKIVLLDPVYGGGDHQKSQDLITDIIRKTPDLKGIFASNEGGAVGAALALKALKRTDLVLVGFDSSPQEVALLEEGFIDGFVVQNPFQMGYKSVMALNDLVSGKTISNRIDTGAKYVNLANLKTPEVEKLLYPLGK